jgi:hypothetical protein
MLIEEAMQKRQLSPSGPRRFLLAMTSRQHELAQMKMRGRFELQAVVQPYALSSRRYSLANSGT